MCIKVSEIECEKYHFDTAMIEGIRELNSFFAEYNGEKYVAGYMHRHQWLRSAFRNYRSSSPEVQGYLKRLVELHTEECRARGSAESRRRHNAFVLTYITDQKYTPKEIARMQRITTRAVWKDLNHVFDDMMLLAFGVDGIKPKAECK